MVTGPGIATRLSIGVQESTQTGQHDHRVPDNGTVSSRPADAAPETPTSDVQDTLKTAGEDRIDLSADAERIGRPSDTASGDDTSAPIDTSAPSTGDPAASAVSAEPQAAASAVGVPVGTAESIPADPQHTPIEDPQATNQDSETEAAEPGNDTKSQTEADRTLGQVIDLFA